MHQDGSQEPIAQMPEIECPHSFECASVCQLPKDGIDEIAKPSQGWLLIGCRFGRMGFAEGSLQHDALHAQVRLHVGQPIVAVSQHNAVGAFQHNRCDFPIVLIGRSQEDMGDDPRPAQAQMQAKAIQDLSVSMIFAVAGYAAKAATPRRTSKATHWNWHTINDTQQRGVPHHLISQVAPQAFLDRPQIGGLPHKRTSMQLVQSRKKVRVVLSKVGKQLLVLRQAQVAAHDFYREHFAIRKLGHRTSLSKSLVSRDGWQHLVNRAKTCNNKVVQVHGSPSQSGFQISLRILHEPFLSQAKLALHVN